MTVSPITATALARQRDLVVIDIRPPDERYGAVGYLPGSLGVPAEALLAEPGRYLSLGSALVLVCLSGHRSLRAAEALSARGVGPLYSLEGGTLAWGAAFPLCGLSAAPAAERVAPERLVRRVVSCFVAESAEAAVAQSRDGTFDPFQTAREIFAREQGDGPLTRSAALRALDRLALLAWRNGHPLDAIARNLDEMRALCLCSLPQ